jgi:hypothetical protein
MTAITQEPPVCLNQERDAPEGFPIRMKAETEWHEAGRGRFTLPAETPGRLVVNLEQEVLNHDIQHLVAETLRRKQKEGESPVAVWIDGRVRVVNSELIRAG